MLIKFQSEPKIPVLKIAGTVEATATAVIISAVVSIPDKVLKEDIDRGIKSGSVRLRLFGAVKFEEGGMAEELKRTSNSLLWISIWP